MGGCVWSRAREDMHARARTASGASADDARGHVAFAEGATRRYVRVLHKLTAASDVLSIAGCLRELATIACLLPWRLETPHTPVRVPASMCAAFDMAVAVSMSRAALAWGPGHVLMAHSVRRRLSLDPCWDDGDEDAAHAYVDTLRRLTPAPQGASGVTVESPLQHLMGSGARVELDARRAMDFFGVRVEPLPHCVACQRFIPPRGARRHEAHGTLFEAHGDDSLIEWAHAYGMVYFAPVAAVPQQGYVVSPRSTAT